MSGNTFGKLFSITSFGESHGPAMGVVIDGMPAKIAIHPEHLQKELERRAPGRAVGTSARQEPDLAEILSGVFEGESLGTPIAVLVKNLDQRSADYDSLKNELRPGHADETYLLKYGRRDHRGGGRASARETVARVIGGYFAGLIIPKIKVRAWIEKLGPFCWNEAVTPDLGAYGFPGINRDQEIQKFLLELKERGESIGGVIRIEIEDCPAGLGEPVFDKIKADFAKGFLSLPACVGFSYGMGEEMANEWGSVVSKDRDHFGGMEGGITNGRKIVMRLTFKPTTTLGKKAQEGRHDPCVLPRAIPIVEAMSKIVLADHYLRQKAYENL